MKFNMNHTTEFSISIQLSIDLVLGVMFLASKFRNYMHSKTPTIRDPSLKERGLKILLSPSPTNGSVTTQATLHSHTVEDCDAAAAVESSKISSPDTTDDAQLPSGTVSAADVSKDQSRSPPIPGLSLLHSGNEVGSSQIGTTIVDIKVDCDAAANVESSKLSSPGITDGVQLLSGTVSAADSEFQSRSQPIPGPSLLHSGNEVGNSQIGTTVVDIKVDCDAAANVESSKLSSPGITDGVQLLSGTVSAADSEYQSRSQPIPGPSLLHSGNEVGNSQIGTTVADIKLDCALDCPIPAVEMDDTSDGAEKVVDEPAVHCDPFVGNLNASPSEQTVEDNLGGLRCSKSLETSALPFNSTAKGDHNAEADRLVVHGDALLEGYNQISFLAQTQTNSGTPLVISHSSTSVSLSTPLPIISQSNHGELSRGDQNIKKIGTTKDIESKIEESKVQAVDAAVHAAAAVSHCQSLWSQRVETAANGKEFQTFKHGVSLQEGPGDIAKKQMILIDGISGSSTSIENGKSVVSGHKGPDLSKMVEVISGSEFASGSTYDVDHNMHQGTSGTLEENIFRDGSTLFGTSTSSSTTPSLFGSGSVFGTPSEYNAEQSYQDTEEQVSTPSHRDSKYETDGSFSSQVEEMGEVKVTQKSKLSMQQRERIRFGNVIRKKDFACYERINGKLVNIVDGLELHSNVFSLEEQRRIVDCVFELQGKGKNGKLKARTYAAPRKWMRGKGRVTIQFGCCYNYVTDRNGNLPGILHNTLVDPIPPLFKVIIKRLVKWHILPPTCVPDSCIVNIYDEGDCIPPHIDNHDFLRPFCTVSFLSECNILFGTNLKTKGPGEFSGSFFIPLPMGSVLVLNGNGADVAKHCVPAVRTKRISITFRKVDESKWPIGFVPEPDLQGLEPLPYGSDKPKDNSNLSKSKDNSNLSKPSQPSDRQTVGGNEANISKPSQQLYGKAVRRDDTMDNSKGLLGPQPRFYGQSQIRRQQGPSPGFQRKARF